MQQVGVWLVQLVRRGQLEPTDLPMNRRPIHAPFAREAGDVPVIFFRSGQPVRGGIDGNLGLLLLGNLLAATRYAGNPISEEPPVLRREARPDDPILEVRGQCLPARRRAAG